MVVRLIVQTLVSFGLMGLFLFGAAGTADWPAAWVFLVEMTVLSIVGGLWLVRHDPALVQERLAPPIQKGQPTADKVLLQVIILVIFGAIVLMALDAVRFAWSSVPFWVQAFGELVLLLSIWISFRTLGETASRRPSSKSKRVEGRRSLPVARTDMSGILCMQEALCFLLALPCYWAPGGVSSRCPFSLSCSRFVFKLRKTRSVRG
jgi:hypothetical protein